MLKSLALSSAILLVPTFSAMAAPDPAQLQTAQQAKRANTVQAPDPNRKVCKTEDLIGSRTGGTRICKTATQWEAEQRQAKQSGEQE